MANKKLLFLSIFFLTPHSLCSLHEHLWTETYLKATQNYWGEFESFSGPGSSLEQTAAISKTLPILITAYNIDSILDLPCGDFNWMRHVDLDNCAYIGVDVVQPLIARNNELYTNQKRHFLHLDVTNEQLPRADLILCRDLLVHFSIQDIYKTIKNFKKSGAKYLLTTTFMRFRPDMNSDIATGGWRTINLQQAPFNFPAPLLLINEQCSEQNGAYSDKSLGLWALDNIKV